MTKIIPKKKKFKKAKWLYEEALQIAEKRREVKGKGERERYTQLRASMVAQMIKNLPTMQETRVQSLGWEDPLEKGKATLSSILAWRSHEQRSLVGYSVWGCRKSDMTERLTLSRSFKYM